MPALSATFGLFDLGTKTGDGSLLDVLNEDDSFEEDSGDMFLSFLLSLSALLLSFLLSLSALLSFLLSLSALLLPFLLSLSALLSILLSLSALLFFLRSHC